MKNDMKEDIKAAINAAKAEFEKNPRWATAEGKATFIKIQLQGKYPEIDELLDYIGTF